MFVDVDLVSTMKRDLCSAQCVVDYDKFGDRGQKVHLRLYN